MHTSLQDSIKIQLNVQDYILTDINRRGKKSVCEYIYIYIYIYIRRHFFVLKLFDKSNKKNPGFLL